MQTTSMQTKYASVSMTATLVKKLRQAERMRVLVESEKKAILDFVCPKVEYRHIVNWYYCVPTQSWQPLRRYKRYVRRAYQWCAIVSVDYFTELDSDAQSDEVVKSLQSFDLKSVQMQTQQRILHTLNCSSVVMKIRTSLYEAEMCWSRR